jgi:nicotinate-nucleotide pyrophosphorylase (carboxylating)
MPQISILNEFIENALAEDIGSGDITTMATIDEKQMGTAVFNVKEDCIIAGIELAIIICQKVDPLLQIKFNVQDGDSIKSNNSIGSMEGYIHSILKIERLILNCMQRMSAIATKTNYLARLIAPYNVQILDTRKTTPNFRICEKWAVRIGGGMNHRFGLYDQFLIKDNHIKAAGGIKNAIQSCISYKSKMNLALPIVVEVSNIDEFNIAKEFKEVDRILIDNFKPDQIKNLLNLNTTNKIIEASGGINASNIEEYAKTGINFVSLGDLTHHVSAVDISLKIV